MHTGESEVARLREQIVGELEALQRVFNGCVLGTTRHDFIRARMDQLGAHQDRLAEYVGADSATHIVCELYIHTVVESKQDVVIE